MAHELDRNYLNWKMINNSTIDVLEDRIVKNCAAGANSIYPEKAVEFFKTSLVAFAEIKEFCRAEGDNGQKYYSSMWEEIQYEQTLLKRLADAQLELEMEIEITEMIKECPGILQREITNKYADRKETSRTVVYHLQKRGLVKKEKFSNTNKLYWIS